MKELLTSEPRLIVAQDPRSAAAEAFRTLRTNIQFKSLDNPVRTMLITSSAPEEGKSTIVANLAVSLAQAGAAVIAVDCDLRNPSLHRIFGLPNERGLTSLMLVPSETDTNRGRSGPCGWDGGGMPTSPAPTAPVVYQLRVVLHGGSPMSWRLELRHRSSVFRRHAAAGRDARGSVRHQPPGPLPRFVSVSCLALTVNHAGLPREPRRRTEGRFARD